MLSIRGVSPRPYYSSPHLLFAPNVYPSTPVADAVSNLVFFNIKSLPVSSEELTLPRSARCALSRLRGNGCSTLLGTYLHRIGRADTLVQQLFLNHRTSFSYARLSCTQLYSSGHLRPLLSILDLCSRHWGVAQLLGLGGVDPRFHL